MVRSATCRNSRVRSMPTPSGRLPGDTGSLNYHVDVYRQSSFYFSNLGGTIQPGTKLPAYTLVNMRLDWADMFGTRREGRPVREEPDRQALLHRRFGRRAELLGRIRHLRHAAHLWHRDSRRFLRGSILAGGVPHGPDPRSVQTDIGADARLTDCPTSSAARGGGQSALGAALQ